LVKTSLNFGIMRLHDDCFTLEAGLRSSVSSEKYALSDKLRYLTESIGGSYTESGDYPAWEYNESSELLKTVTEVYKKQYGKDPVVRGIHAGLECGVIYHNLKPVDIISMGPDIKDVHTTMERLSVSSTQRTWELLLELLKELK
jgi:Di- and tripeptidases